MKERNYKVYKHTSPSKKTYIGITKERPERRWRNGRGYYQQKVFTNAINKYGWDNFKHEILYNNLTKEEAEQKEIELIAYYKSNQSEYGYNVDNGGNCVGKVSEHTKNIQREATKLLWQDEDYRHSVVSKIRRKKVICLNNGILYNSIVECSRSLKLDSSNINKVCQGKQNSYRGYYFIYECDKEKYSKEDIEMILSKKPKVVNKSKIVCLDNGKIYKSPKEAQEDLGISSTAIREVCTNKYKYACGLHFIYEDELNKYSKEEIHNILKCKPQYSTKKKKVICIETQKIYNSITQASKELNVNSGYISSHLHNKYDSVKGYHFKYVE